MTRRAPPERLINRDPGPRAVRIARRATRHAAMADRVARDLLHAVRLTPTPPTPPGTPPRP
jgi:hypothetical protein